MKLKGILDSSPLVSTGNCIYRTSRQLVNNARSCEITNILPRDLYTANHLINSYAKTGLLDIAHQLFDQLPNPNIVSWTALISGYAQNRDIDQCFRLFSQMLSKFRPNDFAYASLLSACDYSRGAQVHALAFKSGFVSWVYVANALIALYSKYSPTDGIEAWRVFDEMKFHNLVTYNSMIMGLGRFKQGDKSMTLFKTMLREGIGFDQTTLLSLVSSLCELNQINYHILGLNCFLQLHSLGLKTGIIVDVRVVTALIKAYSSVGGAIADCYNLFLQTCSHKDIVLWTSVMTAIAEKDPSQTLLLFNRIRREELCPDYYVFSILLKACANLVSEWHASAVHAEVIKVGFVNVLGIENALIHAYARCGSMGKAKQVFNEMVLRDVVSWNSMLMAYALHGEAEAALEFFHQMDVAPDETTFAALLSSCSHTGMVEIGAKIFDSMYNKYGVVPQLGHYACMVDILGRAGRFSEAEQIIRQMPMQPDSVVWSALLGACRIHGEMRLAKLASLKLKEMDPENSLGYVLISNIYCSANNFLEGDNLRKKMNRVGVRKEPGLSWTEVEHRVYEFASGGRRQPQLKAIRVSLEELVGQLKKMGYVPETSLVLYDVEEEHKEEQLYLHSEKLALVFALMNANISNIDRGVIKIIKNIRICLDCHNFMKLASKLVQKVIVVRDANRFHQFKEGACSCNDYW